MIDGPCFLPSPVVMHAHVRSLRLSSPIIRERINVFSLRTRRSAHASSQAPGPKASMFLPVLLGSSRQQQGCSMDETAAEAPAVSVEEPVPVTTRGVVPMTTVACRAAILALAAAAGVWHDEADAAVQSTWDSMRASPWVQVCVWGGKMERTSQTLRFRLLRTLLVYR